MREKTSLTGRFAARGERGDLALEVQIALRAEPAAKERHDDPDIRFGDLQR